MFVPIYVENSGQLLSADKPYSKQFGSDNRSKPLPGNAFDFLRTPPRSQGNLMESIF